MLVGMSLCMIFDQFVPCNIVHEDIPILLASGTCLKLLVQNIILSELVRIHMEEGSIANFAI